jgi:predicted dehydrogenase
MSRPIRWGILGAGNVARLFARGLQQLPDAMLVAVGSRSPGKLKAMVTLGRNVRLYGDYEPLVADDAVDIVYVATTNQLHCEHALLCLSAGKPVLCEKPFTLNAAEAREVVELARRQGLFCMEAMWTRHLPLMRALPELLESGAIGDLRMLRADFGSLPPFEKDNRFFDPSLGGGAMLDLGVYLVSLAHRLLGTPVAISAQAAIGLTGVDEQSAAVLRYAAGQIATIACSLVSRLPTEALIAGTHGQVRVHAPVHRPNRLTLTRYDGERQSSQWQRLLNRLGRTEKGGMLYPIEGNGYQYQAAEAMRCLRAGEPESPVMPLAETLRVMETLDSIRGQLQGSPLQRVA